ncbi:MAG: hypothetical protein AAFV88_02530 [Planctomycetota bacterium]
MTDEEFNTLATVARFPIERRRSELKATLNPWTASTLAVGVGHLLLGRQNVRGTAVLAWYRLVMREASEPLTESSAPQAELVDSS